MVVCKVTSCSVVFTRVASGARKASRTRALEHASRGCCACTAVLAWIGRTKTWVIDYNVIETICQLLTIKYNKHLMYSVTEVRLTSNTVALFLWPTK